MASGEPSANAWVNSACISPWPRWPGLTATCSITQFSSGPGKKQERT
jgi:hypothetical protein